jgi:hypothetical protein
MDSNHRFPGYRPGVLATRRRVDGWQGRIRTDIISGNNRAHGQLCYLPTFLVGACGFEPPSRPYKERALPLSYAPNDLVDPVRLELTSCPLGKGRASNCATGRWLRRLESNQRLRGQSPTSCRLNDTATQLVDRVGVEPTDATFRRRALASMSRPKPWSTARDSNPHPPPSESGAHPIAPAVDTVVDTKGIEPPPSRCKRDVLPLSLRAHIVERVTRIELV